MMEPRVAAWRWELHDAGGVLLTELIDPDQRFASRADAETWLGEAWPELWVGGVAAAALVTGEQRVGQPIPLRPFPDATQTPSQGG